MQRVVLQNATVALGAVRLLITILIITISWGWALGANRPTGSSSRATHRASNGPTM